MNTEEDFHYAVTFEQATIVLIDKLKEQDATVEDVFSICALLPSLLPVCRVSLKNNLQQEQEME